MIKTCFHTHCSFCDGSGAAEEYVKAAVARGFTDIGFSSHAPLDWAPEWTMNAAQLPEYYRAIDALKTRYAGTIRILKGLEIDFLEKGSPPENGPDRYLGDNLDYRIGSVHAVFHPKDQRYYTVDGPPREFGKALEGANNDLRQLVEKYYYLLGRLLREHRFEILGHFDLIKKRCWEQLDQTAAWYRACVDSALDAVEEAGVILEVNTGGLARGALPEIYPSPWILRLCAQRGIPVMLNADAHNPEQIDFYYAEAGKIIREAGYRTVQIPKPEGRQSIEI